MTIKLILSFLAGLMICHSISCNNPRMDLTDVKYTESTMSVLFFTSPTCVPCVKMKKSVWPRPAVTTVLTEYKNSPRLGFVEISSYKTSGVYETTVKK